MKTTMNKRLKDEYKQAQNAKKALKEDSGKPKEYLEQALMLSGRKLACIQIFDAKAEIDKNACLTEYDKMGYDTGYFDAWITGYMSVTDGKNFMVARVGAWLSDIWSACWDDTIPVAVTLFKEDKTA